MSAADIVTAADLERALTNRYMREMGGWAALREVTIEDVVAVDAREQLRERAREHHGRPPDVSMDEAIAIMGAPLTRRIDLLLIRTGKGGKVPHERVAVEIKVSRSDFLRETDEKRGPWQRVAHRFAYAAPLGMVDRSEVPGGCGLLEVDVSVCPSERVRWTVRAPRRDHEPEPMGDRFMAYLAHRAARAERALGATA